MNVNVLHCFSNMLSITSYLKFSQRSDYALREISKKKISKGVCVCVGGGGGGGGRERGGVADEKYLFFPFPWNKLASYLVPQNQNLDFLCSMFPKTAFVPLCPSVLDLFPCIPEINGLVPLFLKPLGVSQHLKFTRWSDYIIKQLLTVESMDTIEYQYMYWPWLCLSQYWYSLVIISSCPMTQQSIIV